MTETIDRTKRNAPGRQSRAPAHPGTGRRTSARAAAQPAEAVRIFQIYYAPSQQHALDAAFEPLDNAGQRGLLLEFDVFKRLAAREDLRKAQLWGALSWKFGQKTGMSGKDFRREIASRPGYDVYFCNPHTEVEALYHNLWLQGETAHPNFLPLCREIFRVAGLPEQMLSEIQPSSEFAACNYFVATPRFWSRYIAFIDRVLDAADRELSETARAILYSSRADQAGLHASATYIPFLVERLFAVFLRLDGAEFRACKIATGKQADSAHLKLLGEMKDLAWRSRSAWMAACWVNYRNLYLDKLHGSTWSKRYLKDLTPPAVIFSPGIPEHKEAR